MNFNQRFLLDAYDDLYAFYKKIKTYNTRNDHAEDMMILRKKAQRFSNFAGMAGLETINADKADSVKLIRYIIGQKKIIDEIRKSA